TAGTRLRPVAADAGSRPPTACPAETLGQLGSAFSLPPRPTVTDRHGLLLHKPQVVSPAGLRVPEGDLRDRLQRLGVKDGDVAPVGAAVDFFSRPGGAAGRSRCSTAARSFPPGGSWGLFSTGCYS